MTPSPAATTGWMPVCTSAPVCSHTAPDGQARSGTPLQYRHWLPKPRQCGDHVGSGYWKTSAAAGAAAGGGADSGGEPLAPGGCTATDSMLTRQRAPQSKPGSGYAAGSALDTPCRRLSGSADVDDDVLELRVEVERVRAELAPHPLCL